MQKVFDSINWFIAALSGAIAILLGAISNPAGAVNTFICKIIDVILIPWPSTPGPLKLWNLFDSLGSVIPIIGSDVIYEIFSTGMQMLLIVLTIKVYKLIPFKMT